MLRLRAWERMPRLAEITGIAFASESKGIFMYLKAASFPLELLI